MEPQFRTRGIYRANAQRLSISLAPLVAQRSLLFRVKADLATKTNYGQLTPTTDESDLYSADLFALTASACLLSAVLSVASAAVSAASIYSQESWKGPHSPFTQLLPPPSPISDTRRHAVAFSPSVRWSRLSVGDMVDVPLSSALSASEHVEIEFSNRGLNSLVAYLPAAMQVALPPSITISKVEGKAGAKLKKKPSSLVETPQRSKTFGNIMSRISLQSSRKEPSTPDGRRKTTMAISNPLPKFDLAHLKPIEQFTMSVVATDYKLPALKTPGPIRMSFIVGPQPQVPALHALLPQNPAMGQTAVAQPQALSQAGRPRPPRATMPPAFAHRARPLAPQPRPRPVTLAPVAAVPHSAGRKLGHRRYKSSPAVMDFAFHEQEKKKESVPPLPPMPAYLAAPLKLAPAPPPRSALRTRAQSTAGHTPPARAIAIPIPGSHTRYGSF